MNYLQSSIQSTVHTHVHNQHTHVHNGSTCQCRQTCTMHACILNTAMNKLSQYCTGKKVPCLDSLQAQKHHVLHLLPCFPSVL